MSEMIERVARALAADHYGERFRKPVDDQQVAANVDANWNIYAGQARVAIAAMREPTADMLEQGNAGLSWNGETYWKESITDAWQYMIDEALGERP